MTGVRIIPAQVDGQGFTRTQGTRVMVGDVELAVSRIVLTAEPANIWRAELTVHAVELPEVLASVEHVTVHKLQRKGPPWDERLRVWWQRVRRGEWRLP